MTKNYKTTIFRFVYINMIKLLYFMFTDDILFSKMAALMQIFKKILSNYFGSHYKYLGHKYIVIQ